MKEPTSSTQMLQDKRYRGCAGPITSTVDGRGPSSLGPVTVGRPALIGHLWHSTKLQGPDSATRRPDLHCLIHEISDGDGQQTCSAGTSKREGDGKCVLRNFRSIGRF